MHRAGRLNFFFFSFLFFILQLRFVCSCVCCSFLLFAWGVFAAFKMCFFALL